MVNTNGITDAVQATVSPAAPELGSEVVAEGAAERPEPQPLKEVLSTEASKQEGAGPSLGRDVTTGNHSRPETQSNVTKVSAPGKDRPLSSSSLRDKVFPNDSELEGLERDRSNEQRRSEINAAVRSLETNVLLILTLAVVFVLYFHVLNFTNKALMLSLYKSLAPILTAVANFGKIQNVLSLYFVSIREKLEPLKLFFK